jgi:hypothetical protein
MPSSGMLNYEPRPARGSAFLGIAKGRALTGPARRTGFGLNRSYGLFPVNTSRGWGSRLIEGANWDVHLNAFKRGLRLLG